ncbi:MAG: CYTH domain-containing protein [Deltaproteobacteria bacterium]|nr:CYTH domain-containing protein [Deltaproteobacteria bacterium]
MGAEIERKFLVRDDRWRAGATGTPYRQGYLAADPDRTVRVRLAGTRGYLTVKGRSRGLERAEFEYEIPAADAEELLDRLCLGPLVEKTRYRLEHAGHVWEVDEFAGENQGLLVAEVELGSADERVELPDWAGDEVSGDPRYYNANLARHPFTRW